MKSFFQRHLFDTREVIFHEDKLNYIEKSLTSKADIVIKYENIDFLRDPSYVTDVNKGLIFSSVIGIAILFRIIFAGILGIELSDAQILNYFIPSLLVVFIGIFFISRKKMTRVWLVNNTVVDFFTERPSQDQVKELVAELFQRSKNARKKLVLASYEGEEDVSKKWAYKRMKEENLIDDEEFDQLNKGLTSKDRGVIGFQD